MQLTGTKALICAFPRDSRLNNDKAFQIRFWVDKNYGKPQRVTVSERALWHPFVPGSHLDDATSRTTFA